MLKLALRDTTQKRISTCDWFVKCSSGMTSVNNAAYSRHPSLATQMKMLCKTKI
jgi:hypothetical protein